MLEILHYYLGSIGMDSAISESCYTGAKFRKEL